MGRSASGTWSHLELRDEGHRHGNIPCLHSCLYHGEVEDLALSPAASQPQEVIAQRNQQAHHLQGASCISLYPIPPSPLPPPPYVIVSLLPIGQQSIAAGDTNLQAGSTLGVNTVPSTVPSLPPHLVSDGALCGHVSLAILLQRLGRL